jgi:hypothetical protein
MPLLVAGFSELVGFMPVGFPVVMPLPVVGRAPVVVAGDPGRCGTAPGLGSFSVGTASLAGIAGLTGVVVFDCS